MDEKLIDKKRTSLELNTNLSVSKYLEKSLSATNDMLQKVEKFDLTLTAFPNINIIGAGSIPFGYLDNYIESYNSCGIFESHSNRLFSLSGSKHRRYFLSFLGSDLWLNDFIEETVKNFDELSQLYAEFQKTYNPKIYCRIKSLLAEQRRIILDSLNKTRRRILILKTKLYSFPKYIQAQIFQRIRSKHFKFLYDYSSDEDSIVDLFFKKSKSSNFIFNLITYNHVKQGRKGVFN